MTDLRIMHLDMCFRHTAFFITLHVTYNTNSKNKVFTMTNVCRQRIVYRMHHCPTVIEFWDTWQTILFA